MNNESAFETTPSSDICGTGRGLVPCFARSPTAKGRPGIRTWRPWEPMVGHSCICVSLPVPRAQRTKDSYHLPLSYLHQPVRSLSHGGHFQSHYLMLYFTRNVSNLLSSQHWVRIQDTWVLSLASLSDLSEPCFCELENGWK